MMERFKKLASEPCSCGRKHFPMIDDVILEKGAIRRLPELIRRYTDGKAFLLADQNTYKAAGEQVAAILSESGIAYSTYVFTKNELEPDETSVGSAIMHFDTSCDIIVTVGSGVLNDIGKLLAKIADLPYIIVGTAPSMDGYASASSSMARDGLKISLNTKCANVVVGDIDILKEAPLKMLKSGLGDMLAKYVSLCDWQIANLVRNDYYCPVIADLVRESLQKCVDNKEGLLKRDEAAVAAVFEGLVLTGVAMNLAGVSAPASGLEHYLSHLWDMRGLEFGTAIDFHGIQCAIGTLIAAKLYEKLRGYTPDKEKALAYAAAFRYEPWAKELKEFLGNASDAIIALEEKEGKYEPAAHAKRLDQILANWEQIAAVIESMPRAAEIEAILDAIDAPKTPAEIGIDESILPMTIRASKDIRDKYVLTRLLWDLGILEESIG